MKLIVSILMTLIQILIAPEFKYVSREALDLLKKMLAYDPERRISA
jgi:serine/threonine protein kinase